MPKALRKALTMSHKCLPKALSEVIKAKTHKYGAERTTCLYGHMHDSKKEAMWCVKLEQLVKEGSITGLLREPHYALCVNDIVVCNHYPDFSYIKNGKQEVLDVKGFNNGTPEFKIKLKLFRAIYPHIKYEVV